VSDDLEPGRLIADRFEIVSLVGRGGMASVYEARDTVLGRVVAIKVFTVDTSDDQARLESEVRLLSGLNHPNLVTVHDASITSDQTGGHSFLVMELVSGRTLRDANAAAPLSPGTVASVTADVAEALSVVHAAGIVHRDVKPSNILLEPSPRSAAGVRGKLADFGIAHTMGSTRVTATGMVVGTAAYLSPEQAEGRDVTPASDIYALGLVTLELLKGEMEYPGGIAESLAARLARDPVVPDTLPADWASLLKEMLARDPMARPTADEVARRSALIAAEPAAAADAAASQTEPAPTELMPTELMPTGDEPTKVLPAAIAAAVPGSDVSATSERTRVLTAAAATSPVEKRRHPARLALIVAAAVVLVIVIVALSQIRPPAAPAGPSTKPLTSQTPAPTTSVVSTVPTPVVTPTQPVPPGKGNGPGKHPGKPGPGNGHGKKP